VNVNIDIALLVCTVAAALWTVMSRSLLKATMGLAITSVLISIIIFKLNSPLAAVFELSVCAGLITAVFVSTISMTKPLTHKEILEISKNRLKRYWYLPVIIAILAVAMAVLKVRQDISIIEPLMTQPDAGELLWNFKRLDVLGQVIILIAGALGVVILFREDDDAR
jgi:NADH-quinone oxidoreductase subunit J